MVPQVMFLKNFVSRLEGLRISWFAINSWILVRGHAHASKRRREREPLFQGCGFSYIEAAGASTSPPTCWAHATADAGRAVIDLLGEFAGKAVHQPMLHDGVQPDDYWLNNWTVSPASSQFDGSSVLYLASWWSTYVAGGLGL